MRKLFGILVVLLFSTTVITTSGGAIEATWSKFYGIIDLQMMDEREYDSNRDKTIIGLIIPKEVFQNMEDCETALIGRYAGDIWDIERTRNPYRGGELRLHKYKSEYEGGKMVKRIKNVRFCTMLVHPISE